MVKILTDFSHHQTANNQTTIQDYKKVKTELEVKTIINHEFKNQDCRNLDYRNLE
jgi:hypothetical protein